MWTIITIINLINVISGTPINNIGALLSNFMCVILSWEIFFIWKEK